MGMCIAAVASILLRLDRRDMKHDRQSAYTATLRRVRVNIVVVEEQEVSHILSVCFFVCLYP
jgi:hypothetical protein